MRYFFVTILLTIASTIFANQTRLWNDGPLTWEDFTGTPAIKTTPTYFKGVLQTKTIEQVSEGSKLNSETTFSTFALAVMEKSQSYADSIGRTPQMLRYHQLQFDLLELMRRRLQAELNNGVAGIEADNRVKYYQRLYDEKINELAKYTINGSNDYRLQEEEYYIRKNLDEFYLPKASNVSPGKFVYGGYIGTGAFIPMGGIEDFFQTAWLFNIGITTGYQHIILKADISYGQPSLTDRRKEILASPGTTSPGAKEWAANENANLLTGVVSLGYQIVDTKHFSITPHIGGGWTNYSWNVADYILNPDNPDGLPEKEYIINSDIRKNKIHNFNFMAGIDFDWHFHTVVADKISFLSGRREQFTSSLRLSPYAMRQKYNKLKGEPCGWQFGITLTYTGIARSLGLK